MTFDHSAQKVLSAIQLEQHTAEELINDLETKLVPSIKNCFIGGNLGNLPDTLERLSSYIGQKFNIKALAYIYSMITGGDFKADMAIRQAIGLGLTPSCFPYFDLPPSYIKVSHFIEAVCVSLPKPYLQRAVVFAVCFYVIERLEMEVDVP